MDKIIEPKQGHENGEVNKTIASGQDLPLATVVNNAISTSYSDRNAEAHTQPEVQASQSISAVETETPADAIQHHEAPSATSPDPALTQDSRPDAEAGNSASLSPIKPLPSDNISTIKDRIELGKNIADKWNKWITAIAAILTLIVSVTNMLMTRQVPTAVANLKKLDIESNKLTAEIRKLTEETHKLIVESKKIESDIKVSSSTLTSISLENLKKLRENRWKLGMEISATVMLEKPAKNFHRYIKVDIKLKNSGLAEAFIDLTKSHLAMGRVVGIEKDRPSNAPDTGIEEGLELERPVFYNLTQHIGFDSTTFWLFSGEEDHLVSIQEVNAPGLYLVSFVLKLDKVIIAPAGGETAPVMISSSDNEIASSVRSFILVE